MDYDHTEGHQLIENCEKEYTILKNTQLTC